MTWTAIRRAAPALALATLVLLPFLGKAFTIDDTLFMRQAEHVLVDPLHPTAFEMVWSEFPVPMRVSSIMPSGRIMAYLLLPSACLGGAEWAAHLVSLILLLAGITATVLFGLRLGLTPRQAGIAAWLLSATPVALAMAGTAMPDIPAMAFGVIGLERLLAWKDEQRWHQGVLAAVALALAALSRSHLALFLGLGALLLFGGFPDRRLPAPRRWQALVFLGMAAIITAGALTITRDPQPEAGGIASSALLFSASANLPPNVVAFLVHWVLVIPLGLPWLLIRRREVLRNPILYLAAISSAVIILPRSRGTAYLLLIAVAAGIGAAVLWDILAGALRRRDRTQLLLGLWLLLPLPVALYLHMPSKFQLAAAPAAALLVAREISRLKRRPARWVLISTIALGAGLGVLILKADAAFAGLGRRAAAELIAPYTSLGKRVWFEGHWGFQWYAEKAGGRPLSAVPPRPSAGDYLVTGRNCAGFGNILPPKRTLIVTLADDSPGGRIMIFKDGIGFYSNHWGLLPWAWGTGLIDRFDLWAL